jgi:hypothetical protein
MRQNRRKTAVQLDFKEPQHRILTHVATGREIQEWQSVSMPSWRLLNGPAKESLDLIEDESIDCVVIVKRPWLVN